MIKFKLRVESKKREQQQDWDRRNEDLNMPHRKRRHSDVKEISENNSELAAQK